MSTILLKAAVEIAALNSFESVFENLRKHLISLEVCKEVTFFVCRFNGDSCYPQKNCRLEKASLKTLQNIQPETVAEQEGELQCVNKLSTDSEFNDNDVAKLNLVSTYVANTLELASLHKRIQY